LKRMPADRRAERKGVCEDVMARITITPPTEFEEKLSRLGDRTDEIVEKVLQAGGEVALEKVRLICKAHCPANPRAKWRGRWVCRP
jgi:hypothetical protein